MLNTMEELADHNTGDLSLVKGKSNYLGSIFPNENWSEVVEEVEEYLLEKESERSSGIVEEDVFTSGKQVKRTAKVSIVS